MLIQLLLAVIFIHLITTKNNEHFYNIHKMESNKYVNCCRKYGCKSTRCKKIMHKRNRKYVREGILYNINNHNDQIELYHMYDYDTKKFKYYYIHNNRKELLTKSFYIPHNTIFDIDGKKYRYNITNEHINKKNDYVIGTSRLRLKKRRTK